MVRKITGPYRMAGLPKRRKIMIAGYAIFTALTLIILTKHRKDTRFVKSLILITSNIVT